MSKIKKITWKKFTAVAACAVMIAGIGVISWKSIVSLIKSPIKPPIVSQTEPPIVANLPMLTLDAEGYFGDGMGFEGYMANDISELINGNPWSGEADISVLPVFENTIAYDEKHQVVGADIDKMKAYLIKVAKTLNLDTDNLKIKDDRPDEETKKQITDKFKGAGNNVPEGYFDTINIVFGKDKGIKVEVDTSLMATVFFEPPVSLPDQYNFTYYAPYKDAVLVADYLKNEYKAFINMKNPKANVFGGYYNIYKQQLYGINFFDEKGDLSEQIIDYNFNIVRFHCDDDGKLFIARIYPTDLSHKIGDYPIIEPFEAEALLLKGNYITTVPEAFPGEQYIRKTELIYRTGYAEKIYLPYYCIYVEMPTMKLDKGLNNYGVFYVPAVKGEYIENMPLRDGSFN